MRRAIVLRREPTVQQTSRILSRIEGELKSRGARLEPEERGALRFQMPRPWRAPRLGFLLGISAGRVAVSAGAGGPWRVRYHLRFTLLTVIALVISAALIIVGLGWARLDLLSALLLVWVLGYGSLYFAAAWRFRQLLRSCVAAALGQQRASPTGPPVGGRGGTRTIS